MFFNSKLKKKIEELESKIFNLNRQLTRKERDNSVKDSQIKDLRDKIRFYENRKVTTDPNTPYNPRTDRYDSPSSYSSQYEDNNTASTIAAVSLLSGSSSSSYNNSCSSYSSSSSYDSSSSCDSSSSYSE